MCVFLRIANLVTLMETGPVVEKAIGTRDMARLFLLSGVSGSADNLQPCFIYCRG
jgi:hypothetical protein